MWTQYISNTYIHSISLSINNYLLFACTNIFQVQSFPHPHTHNHFKQPGNAKCKETGNGQKTYF